MAPSAEHQHDHAGASGPVFRFPSAVGETARLTLHSGHRVYFARDERTRLVFRCKVCGAWPDEEAHGKGCTPQVRAAASIRRINAGLKRQ